MSNVTFNPDPQLVFNYAIRRGSLSMDPNHPMWAGNFMYMSTDRFEHAFKHRDTRKYTYVPVR